MALATTVKEFVSLRCWALTAAGLKSVTTVVNRLVLGTPPGTGVHVITPLVSITALVGATSKEYANTLAGRSESVAVFVTVRFARPAMVWLVCTGSTGGRLTSWTTI